MCLLRLIVVNANARVHSFTQNRTPNSFLSNNKRLS